MDFDRNEFERTVSFISKHHRQYLGKRESLTKLLQSLISLVVNSREEYSCQRACDMLVYRNDPGSRFKVEIKIDLRPGCPDYVA